MPAIASGTRFGIYEIVAPLGAGGMGEVYRARDTKLKRDAAIKVLPAELAEDHVRLGRFEQEARAASSLNHPNIVTIYEIGDAGGVPYIAMELVEGRTVRYLLEPGALPVRRLLEVAAQVADGLAKAHSAGIVHRDLKPENLMVSADGFVKILDFGLAKLSPQKSGDLYGKTTVLETEPGAVMGTVAYMSPEQASGREIDFRSDQFAFGSILYEMATGKRPFRAESSAQTMTAIIQDEPRPIAELNPKAPAPLRWLIERCMSKERERRYASTTDLARDLATLRDRLSEASTATAIAPAGASRRRPRAAALAAGLLAAGAVGAWLNGQLRPRPSLTSPYDPGAFRFTPFATDPAEEAFPAWSPDGKSIAFIRPEKNVPQIFVQRLDSPVATQVTNEEEFSFRVVWAPDGGRIYYVAPRPNGPTLFSVGVVGGAPEKVLEGVLDPSITPDGRAIVFVKDRSRLLISSPPGSEPKELPREGKVVESGLAAPRFSPDGRKLAVWCQGKGRDALAIVDYPEGRWRTVDWDPPPGTRLAVSWFPDSRRVAVGGEPESGGALWIVDTVDGGARQVTAGPGVADWSPAVSPDGTKIAFTLGKRERDIVEIPIDGTAVRPLLASSLAEGVPSWAPSGNRFAYALERGGSREIWLRSPDEGWDRPLVTSRDFEGGAVALDSPSFSPDGRWIAYQVASGSNDMKIWISSAAGGPPVPLAGGKALGDAPTWSPDGRSIAFVFVGGPRDSHLMRAEVGSSLEPEQLAEAGGWQHPHWSPIGDWISYWTAHDFMLVSPDGKRHRTLLEGVTLDPHGWTRDGKTIYGMRAGAHGHTLFCAVDVATARLRTIRDLGVAEGYEGFSLAPDGRSFATSIYRTPGDIWILEGLTSASDRATGSR